MKCLVVALLLCVQLHFLHGACVFMKLTQGMTHCQDGVDKTWHPVGSTWRNSACERCTCESCCTVYPTNIKVPDDCMYEFDQKECRYNVFKKTDRTQSCPIIAAAM